MHGLFLHKVNVGTGFGSQSFSYITFFMKNKIILRLQAPWETVKEKMKENDINLTDADLEYEPGNEEDLLQRLEKLMSKPRDQIVAYIESISSNEGLAG